MWLYFKESLFYVWEYFSFYLTISMIISAWSFYVVLKTDYPTPRGLLYFNIIMSIIVTILWFICYLMDPGYIISIFNK